MTTPEHDSAVQRLDVEHVEQERLRVRYKAAIGAPADHRRLGAADDQVAPREAWLRWIHEDSYRGLNAGPFELLAEQPSLGVGSDHVVGREVKE